MPQNLKIETILFVNIKDVELDWANKKSCYLNHLKEHGYILCFLEKFHAISTAPYCRIYVSVNRVNIGLDNGVSPIRHQAIIRTMLA